MIKQISLDHSGGFYFYSINHTRTSRLCKDFPSLREYLEKMFYKCPDNYFNSGPRSSALKFKTRVELKDARGHELSSLSKHGLRDDSYQSNHMKVQMFLLQNDPKTIAIEVPVWLKYDEIDDFEMRFNSKRPLTGHIDILRVEDGKIWVWDYKPKAEKEEYASTQTLFYALMLSKRTGIGLEKFRCGYFDDKNTYLFKPEKEQIAVNQVLNKFF